MRCEYYETKVTFKKGTMANDLIQFGESRQTMSSLEIAKLTGKPHNDEMKAIPN